MYRRLSLALLVALLASSCGSSAPHGGLPDVTEAADAELPDALSDQPDRGPDDADSAVDDLPEGDAALDAEGLTDGPDDETDAAEVPRVLLGYKQCMNTPPPPEPCPPPRYAVPALTHFVHRSFTLGPHGEFPGVGPYGCPCLVRAGHEVGARILISFGDGTSADFLCDVVGNPIAEETAARSIASALVHDGYDGVEIDSFSARCTRSVAPLASQLRSALDALGAGHPLAVVLPPDPAGRTHDPDVTYDMVFDVPALLASVDLFVLRTSTDGGGSYHCWDPYPGHTGHAFPLWTPAADPCAGTPRPASVSDSVMEWLARGVPPEKMIIPLSFSGRQFLASSLYEPYPSGNCAWLYYGFPLSSVRERLSDPAWTHHFDPEAGVPYLVAARGLISYEDEESIRLKCEFARTEDLRGAAVLNVGFDWDPATDATPLMDATLEACAAEP